MECGSCSSAADVSDRLMSWSERAAKVVAESAHGAAAAGVAGADEVAKQLGALRVEADTQGTQGKDADAAASTAGSRPAFTSSASIASLGSSSDASPRHHASADNWGRGKELGPNESTSKSESQGKSRDRFPSPMPLDNGYTAGKRHLMRWLSRKFSSRSKGGSAVSTAGVLADMECLPCRLPRHLVLQQPPAGPRWLCPSHPPETGG